MNDYDLINALLEDGSPQSILKLKMIYIDFYNFSFGKINFENHEFFRNNFKDYYEQYLIMATYYAYIGFSYSDCDKKFIIDDEFVAKIFENKNLKHSYDWENNKKTIIKNLNENEKMLKRLHDSSKSFKYNLITPWYF